MARIISNRLIYISTDLIRSIQKRSIIMSAQLRADKLMEEMKQKNPYFEKYASKIATIQQSSPEEFLQRIEHVERKHKPKKEERQRNYTELLRPKTGGEQTAEVPHKKLGDIMKLELLQDRSIDDLEKIWLEYHKEKDVVVAAIPSESYDLQMKRGKEYPLFILPLPRSQGYEFFLLQFAANTVHLTPLLCYQVHKENAPECLNLVYYTEFRDQGLILMRGEYDTNVIDAQEAQCLVNQLQLYYAQSNHSKLELLEKFTKRPDSFKHMEVINEMHNIKLEN